MRLARRLVAEGGGGRAAAGRGAIPRGVAAAAVWIGRTTRGTVPPGQPLILRDRGLTETELIGKTFQETTLPDDRAADLAPVNPILAGQTPYGWKSAPPRGSTLSGITLAIGGPLARRADAVGWGGSTTSPGGASRGATPRPEHPARGAGPSERQAHEALKRAESQLVQAEKLTALGQLVAGSPTRSTTRWRSSPTTSPSSSESGTCSAT